MSKMYTAGRAAFVGVGIDHDDLVNYARHFNLPQSAADTAKSSYYGGMFSVRKSRNLTVIFNLLSCLRHNLCLHCR